MQPSRPQTDDAANAGTPHDYSPEVTEAKRILPAWFTERMMTDDWGFGLLLTTGQMLAITGITAVTVDASGAIWLDVRLANSERNLTVPRGSTAPYTIINSPTDDRTEASVNARHIVAALELETS